MEKTKHIRSYQLFCILLLSRLLSLLTMVSVTHETLRTTDYLISVLWGGVFLFLFSIPVLIYLHLYPRKDLVDLAFGLSPKLSKAVSIVYALYFSYFSLITLSTLKLFVGTSVFPNDESAFFIIICILASCYAASLGIEAIGRASTVTLGIFIFAFLFLISIMANKVHLTNFSPLFYDGISPAARFGLRIASLTYEPAMVLILAPKVNGNLKKMYGKWFGCLFFSMFVIFFFAFGGLGHFAVHQLFPVYSMAVLSELSVFQRFDVLLTGVWILTAFIKVSLLFYLQAELLKKSFGEKLKHQYIYILAILVFVIQYGLRGKVTNYLAMTKLWIRAVGAILFMVVIPLCLILADRRKQSAKRREYHAKENL